VDADGTPPATDATRAHDWFPRVADELLLLEPGVRSWRIDAATRLRALAEKEAELSPADGDLLTLVAAELAADEDEGALELGLVTWRTLAADELSALAITLRTSPSRAVLSSVR
jgi:hypothetical protein